MPMIDQVKNYARKLVEGRPDEAQLKTMLRKKAPTALRFQDDGVVPNNSHFPVAIYRQPLNLRSSTFDPAVIIDVLFANNGWGRSWRDTVYDFVHYHSQVHEVMGVARGHATLELGGIKGRRLKVKTGDVVVLPAGTGHRLLASSRDFLVVGAYPAEGTYDECTDIRDRSEAAKRVAKVRKPKADPLFGRQGPLTRLWKR